MAITRNIEIKIAVATNLSIFFCFFYFKRYLTVVVFCWVSSWTSEIHFHIFRRQVSGWSQNQETAKPTSRKKDLWRNMVTVPSGCYKDWIFEMDCPLMMSLDSVCVCEREREREKERKVKEGEGWEVPKGFSMFVINISYEI